MFRTAHDSECAAEESADADGGHGADPVLSVCGGPARPAAVHGRVAQQVCPRRACRHERYPVPRLDLQRRYVYVYINTVVEQIVWALLFDDAVDEIDRFSSQIAKSNQTL